MDAASNNGVDDVRGIIDQVAYSPTQGKYRVFIIDEVHMLSGAAFNALLKTLEEPPAYAIFILATTEPNKLPLTILSRCQRYDFGRLSVQTIEDRLKVVCDSSKMGEDGYHGAPDFIIEVLSPKTRSRDMLQKLHWYWEAGVKEYWMIDIPERLVYRHVFVPDYKHDILSFDEDLSVSICPGFAINLREMGF